jgi:phage N-6-adenine-methyltransferase
MSALAEDQLRQCWGTPPELFAQLDREYRFTVDACAYDWNAKLPRFWTPEQDGLAQDWSRHNVFCNPPYTAIDPWIEIAYRAWRLGGRSCLLLPARPDRRWWHSYAMRAAHVDLFRGRVEYVAPPGVKRSTNREPSCVVVFQPDGDGPQFRARDHKTGELIGATP